MAERARRILIVDDEANTRLALTGALEGLGYELEVAESASEALRALVDPAIELVLLDLKMPGGSGLEVLRYIERERPTVRAVVVTAHGTIDSTVESMKLGALDVIQKPFSLDQIRALVSREMDGARRQREAEERYLDEVRRAREKLREHDLKGAVGHLHRALEECHDRPEAHNLMGVVEEARGRRSDAHKHWRMALLVAPGYQPAKDNLHRSVTRSGGALDLG